MSDTVVADPPLWRRVVRSPLFRLVVLGAGLIYYMGWAQALLEEFHDRPFISIPLQMVLALSAIAIYVAFARLLENREATELSTPGLMREWAIGAVCGAGLYTACAVSLMLLGIYRVEGFNSAWYLLPGLALAIKSGVFEELIFRGVLHRSVEAVFGSWAGIVVSSLVFGLLHLLNPSATLGGAIYISIEAGLLLSAAYLVTRRLWICMGFHMSWNFVQEAVFSGAVSGNAPEPGLMKATIEGPELLTGGSFGMEQSIFALVYCTTMGVILLVIAIRRGHMLPPMWKR